MTAPQPLTARAVTRALTAAGFHGFQSQIQAEGVVRVTQRYAAGRALTPGDLRARREARARLAQGVLIREPGWAVARIGDRLTVTVDEAAPHPHPCSCGCHLGPA